LHSPLKDGNGKGVPITYVVVGERGVRDLNFSRGQNIEGGIHLLSLAVWPSLTLQRAGTHLQLGELGDCTEAMAFKRSPIHLVATTLDAA